MAAITLAALLAFPLPDSLAQDSRPSPDTMPRTPPTSLDLRANRLRFTYTRPGNIRLFVDGVPVITESHLYLVKPGWTGMLLNTDDITPKFSTFTETGTQVGTANFENENGYARFRFELRPDNSLTVRLAYSTNGTPAEVEFDAGYLNAVPIAGMPFSAETVTGARRGNVPEKAKTESQEASRLTPFFRKMRLDSRLGPLTIEVQGNNEATSTLNLFDARKGTADWAKRHPIFWLGIGSPTRPVAAGENTVAITYWIGDKPGGTVTTPVKAATGSIAAAIKEARVPYLPERPLIPKPKELVSGKSPLRLTAKSRIVMPANPIPQEKRAATEIQRELSEFFHRKVSVAEGVKPATGDIAITRKGASVAPPDKPEGYLLTVGANGATLTGNDPRGTYNAAQTLKQLLRLDAKGVYIKPVTVRDWPTLLWRGVHWFGGPEAFPFHERMITRILAPLKYNEMVYQVDYTAWDSQPQLRGPRVATKAQVRQSIALAREHFLDPIPLLPSLRHMEWMFTNNANRDFVADPSHPYTLDPENPKSYDALFSVMQEVIEVFEPKWVHIGHDEVTLEGTFPKKGSTKTVTELFVYSVNKIHSWLTRKGIRAMLWGDMMLHPSEGSGGAAFAPTKEDAAKRRADIPKDIVVADWHYNAGGDFPSIPVLQRDGFELLVSTWYDPGNIRTFAQAAAKANAKGLLQTTWAGYTLSMDTVRGASFAQFVGYLIAAEHAWNGGANDPDALGYDPEEAFLALWDRSPADRLTLPGFAVNLASLSNTKAANWLPGSPSLPSGTVTLGGIRYHTNAPVLLAGAFNPAGTWPQAVSLPIGNRKAATLEWLWGTSYPALLNTPIARLTVEYADGKTAEEPIVYGKQIRAFTDSRACSDARTVWQTDPTKTGRASVRAYRWQNPRPEAPITRVTLTSEGTEAAPVLLGLTGVGK